MDFFIKRPIFAAAIALMMVIVGAISMFMLPIAQYPPLVPGQIKVSTQYIGESSDVVADTVTTPLEEQLNGAEGINVIKNDPLYQIDPRPYQAKRDPLTAQLKQDQAILKFLTSKEALLQT